MSFDGSDWSAMVAEAVCAENNSEATNTQIRMVGPVFIRHLLASDALVISKGSAAGDRQLCSSVDAKLLRKMKGQNMCNVWGVNQPPERVMETMNVCSWQSRLVHGVLD